MSVKPRDELARKYSQQPIDRFGVHFEYQDLCARLKELELHQNQNLNASLRPLPRKPSRSTKQRSMLGTYANSGELKRVLGAKGFETQSNISRGALNRSVTPNKLKGRRVFTKTQAKLPPKLKPRHIRQSSLPIFANPLPPKPVLKVHKKSASIYSTVDF